LLFNENKCTFKYKFALKDKAIWFLKDNPKVFMPIYEFICKSCSEKFEKLTSFDWQSAGIECPRCKSNELERFVSLIGGFATKNSNGGEETSKMSLSGTNPACSGCSGKSCSTC